MASPTKARQVPIQVATRVCLSLTEQCALDLLANWRSVRVRCVPGVMTQVMLYDDEHVEARLHIFQNGASETYIHDHACEFMSLCLRGGYRETLWRIDHNATSDRYFEFTRQKGNNISAPRIMPGALVVDRVREHSPGNVLYTDRSALHSVIGTANDLVTLVIRCKSTEGGNTRIVAAEPNIYAPTTKIREATVAERVKAFECVRSLLCPNADELRHVA